MWSGPAGVASNVQVGLHGVHYGSAPNDNSCEAQPIAATGRCVDADVGLAMVEACLDRSPPHPVGGRAESPGNVAIARAGAGGARSSRAPPADPHWPALCLQLLFAEVLGEPAFGPKWRSSDWRMCIACRFRPAAHRSLDPAKSHHDQTGRRNNTCRVIAPALIQSVATSDISANRGSVGVQLAFVRAFPWCPRCGWCWA